MLLCLWAVFLFIFVLFVVELFILLPLSKATGELVAGGVTLARNWPCHFHIATGPNHGQVVNVYCLTSFAFFAVSMSVPRKLSPSSVLMSNLTSFSWSCLFSHNLWALVWHTLKNFILSILAEAEGAGILGLDLLGLLLLTLQIKNHFVKVVDNMVCVSIVFCYLLCDMW